jgi:hypothetical protein
MNAIWKKQKCTTCVYCELVNITADDFLLYCKNLTTKNIPHPIGFLDPNAMACSFFQPKNLNHIPASSLHWVDVAAVVTLMAGLLIAVFLKAFILTAFLATLMTLLVTLARSKKMAFKADIMNGKIEYIGEQ